MLKFHVSSALILCSNDKIIALIRKLHSRKMLNYRIGSLFVIGQLHKDYHGV